MSRILKSDKLNRTTVGVNLSPSLFDNHLTFNINYKLASSATNFAGASIAATGVLVDADSVGVADASVDSVAIGAGAASSSFEDDCDQTTKASSAIPTITAITTRLDAPCCGLAAGAGVAGRTGATGAAARGADEVTGTAGTLTVAAEDLFAAAFFFATRFLGAAFLATAFFATLFFATAFLATLFAGFLAAAFLIVLLAAGFLAALFFLATAFFAAGFLATAFLAGAFFVAFLATFFFTATLTPWVAVRAQVTHSDKPRLPQRLEHF